MNIPKDLYESSRVDGAGKVTQFMKEIIKKELADAIRSMHLPRYEELPNGGLYLEQTVQYINGCIAPLGCSQLTGSMVSNYVKQGVFPGPVKKQSLLRSKGDSGITVPLTGEACVNPNVPEAALPFAM